MIQRDRVKAMLGIPGEETTEDATIDVLLDSATNVIMSRRFPSGKWPEDVDGNPALEPRYRDLQARIATELFERRGASTHTGYSENGIGRSWENAGVSQSLLAEIMPVVEVYR